MISTNYFHAIDGRIRIHIEEMKGSWEKARETAAKLTELEGILNVSANPTTGNVLINYDPRRMSQGDVLQALWGLGYLRKGKLTVLNEQTRRSGRSELGDTVTRIALEALFFALTG